MNAIKAAIRQLGHKVYVLKTTGETDGDRPAGVLPVKRIKRDQIVGMVQPPTEELLAEMGIELTADAVLFCFEAIDLNDDIQHDGISYEIIREQKGKMYLQPDIWAYVLQRVPSVATDVPGDGIKAVGYALTLELSDTHSVGDKLWTDQTADDIEMNFSDRMAISYVLSSAANFKLNRADTMEIRDAGLVTVPPILPTPST